MSTEAIDKGIQIVFYTLYNHEFHDSWTPQAKASVCLIGITALATFIIGNLAWGGALSAPVAGWSILGLGVGGFVARLTLGNLKERSLYVVACALVAATFVMLGALGGAGMFSGSQLGLGVLLTSCATIVVKPLGIVANLAKEVACSE